MMMDSVNTGEGNFAVCCLEQLFVSYEAQRKRENFWRANFEAKFAGRSYNS